MSDYRQWPTIVKVTMPVWLPLFLLAATLFYLIQLARRKLDEDHH